MDDEFDQIFEDEYDAIVLGTGLKESTLSGLLGVNGKKVLHLDKNDYYGAECASMTPLTKLFELFDSKKTPTKEEYGSLRDYNVDLIPKFLMGGGALVKMLIQTDVTKYLQFKCVDGSFVYKGGKLFKVPVTAEEALKTSLMGIFEKRRFKNFLIWVQKWDPENPKTWDGYNPNTATMAEIYSYWGLDNNTQDFVGHAIALHTDDSYKKQRGYASFMKEMQLYSGSLALYRTSPYLYPLYGLGDLPQGFARLSAVYGGTFMLRCPIEEVVYNDAGEAYGVKITTANGPKIARGKTIIGDPSYFPGKVRKQGKVVRCICLLDAPVPGTNGSESCQVILPQNQIGRQNDVYVMVMSSSHCVAAQGRYIAIVSTTVETSNPEAELAVGLKLLGPIREKFYAVKDMEFPTDNGLQSKAIISTTYDATSHFETTCDDIMDMWKRMTGEVLDLSKTSATLESE